MSPVRIAIAVALALLVGAGDLAPAHADCASGRYYKYRHESLSNDPPYAWGGLITVYCCRNGLGQGGCGAAEGGYCPNVVSVKKDEYRCDGTAQASTLQSPIDATRFTLLAMERMEIAHPAQ